jgi:hypothetical protein
VIWDVTTNNQILLAVGWDAIRKRNFIDRQGIFINTTEGYLQGLTADNITVRFDLATGTPLDIPQQIDSYTASQVVAGAPAASNAGGNCISRINNGYVVVNVGAQSLGAGQIEIPTAESIQQADFNPANLARGCRYLMVAIQRPDAVNPIVYDTYAFDVVGGRRLIFEDARTIPHPVTVLAADKVLVGTRNGGYWWNLATDERVLLTQVVSSGGSYGGSYVRNFENVQTVDGVMYASPVDEPDTLAAYQVDSGAFIATYDNQGRGVPVRYIVQGN